MKNNKNIARNLTYISQFAINMLVPIFLCSFIGLYIDKKFQTSYWFIILFFVGAVAGARNIYILAKKSYEEKEDKQK
ncbi:MAG: AtpZ/AtpI family protein [Lachnospiraceae bacterium]|nr:AtpZ/AtpI family protein [Candidatus Colinaster equi]